MAQGLIGTDATGNLYSILIVPDVNGPTISVTPVHNVTPSNPDGSITQKALALIASSLRLIGVLASGEAVPIEEANDGLMVLNQMLDSWNADRLAIYTTNTADFALTSGQQAYTFGIGGDFNTTWPARIDSMSAILLNNPTNPIEVPMDMYSVEDWQTKLPVKNVSGSFPLICYDDGGFPLRTLSMWPIPQGQAVNVRIYSWQGLGMPANLQANVNFPPGYAEAFRYNLAVRLSAEFAAPLPPSVAAIAIESLARIKSMNAPSLELRSDLCPTAGGSNYRAELFGLGW